ncbi:hypothetical protein HH213_17230 [Duganella dendranthematis]|uniref:Lipoprotein n=1 Tax=Duganella dendranthematis TaxID=2728021 RepID=A0ABX6MBF9_9BURK|nr:hypothetical protein [Duganella dendranthematis]QJD91675.1 hypothetical protein HH213_17230 [Duganella dendranthematis]
MFKGICAAAIAVSLVGCVATKDGMRFGTGSAPSDSDVARVRSQIAENAQKSAAKKALAEALTPAPKPGVLVIGETGVLREMDLAKLDQEYKAFSVIAEKWHPGVPPHWTKQDYGNRIGGVTTLEIYSIPGIINLKLPAAVPRDRMTSINFASIAGAWLMNSTKDLVIARSIDDGILVIERVLCSSASEDYRSCASQYAPGRYDAVSGIEVDRSFKLKTDGVRIDITTFKKI